MSMMPEKLWFETISSLNRAMLLIEKVEHEHKDLIAQQAFELAKSMRLCNSENADDIKNIGYDKLVGMMKVKSCNRWFCSVPTVMKALNEVYFLGDDDRYQVGLKMLLSLQALNKFLADEDTDDGTGSANWNRRLSVSQVIKSVFNRDLEVFSEQGKQKKQEKAERIALAKEEEDETLRVLEEEWQRIQSEGLYVDEAPEDSPDKSVLQAVSTKRRLITMEMEGASITDFTIVVRDKDVKMSGQFKSLSTN
jgi:hypothetical protein